MKIVIPDDYQDAVRHLECFKLLAAHDVTIYNDTERELDRLAQRLQDAEALVLIRERTRITAALLERLPKLKVISQTGRAGPHVDVEACTARGVLVLGGSGSSPAPSELTWALIMAAQRRIPQYAAQLKQGNWQQAGLTAPGMPPNFGLGRVLEGQTLGILGYGKIGARIAGYGRAFGMHVLVWSGEKSMAAARDAGYDIAASQRALFERSDVLSVHLRLSAQTRGMVRLADLQRMQPDALFVNTSRAELVETGALATALAAGRPGMAAVDVFEDEPVGRDEPLLQLENALCTPHIGYVERGNYELYFGGAFQNIVDFLQGNTASVLNPHVRAPR